jgi:hypothetical protein
MPNHFTLANDQVTALLAAVKQKHHSPRLDQAEIVVCFDEGKPFKKGKFNWGKVVKFSPLNKMFQGHKKYDFLLIPPPPEDLVEPAVVQFHRAPRDRPDPLRRGQVVVRTGRLRLEPASLEPDGLREGVQLLVRVGDQVAGRPQPPTPVSQPIDVDGHFQSPACRNPSASRAVAATSGRSSSA